LKFGGSRGENDLSNLRQELQEVLRCAARALAEGSSVAAFAELLYAPDVVLVGEGMERALCGLKASLPMLTEFVGDFGVRPEFTFEVQLPILAGTDTAAAFVTVNVRSTDSPGETGQFRALYAWRRTVKGWRVALEMFGTGVL
jgi:ketosteroid isomerase-like protein